MWYNIDEEREDNMKTYSITVEITVNNTVEIEAESEVEALEQAYDQVTAEFGDYSEVDVYIND